MAEGQPPGERSCPIGNAGTAIYGRMDSDELAMPAYQTLSPAVKSKLRAEIEHDYVKLPVSEIEQRLFR